MASAAGRRLTETHRKAQVRLAAHTIAAMRAIWDLLDPDDLDGSFDRWLTAAFSVVEGQRSTSSSVAAAYLTAFRRTELGQPATPVLAGPAPRDAVATSLLVTGPVSVKQAMRRGTTVERAMQVAEAASSAAAMRHVLDGGRDTIAATVQDDTQASGFQRVASGNACAYCSGLAGIEFPDDHVFAAHDGCSCTSEPVYR